MLFPRESVGSEALDARGAFAGDTGVHRLEETEPRETLPPFFRVLGVSSEYHSGYAGGWMTALSPASCFFGPLPWGSLVRWKGEQSTMSLTDFTSLSSKAIMSEIGFITEPGSEGEDRAVERLAVGAVVEATRCWI